MFTWKTPLGRFVSILLLALPVVAGDKDADKDKKKWDVNNFSKETFEVKVETDEGTWMHLDVSPDGKTIVFDLLGDIYTMPIDGGKATLVAGGMAWEMQPTFSPDGKSIAFTSDRGGGDNIWVTDLKGENARQITKETFRLPNSPAWSPDGRFIAARKHFSSSRSLGSGEIWLWHASGDQSGIQLNEKPNKQKDLGEPSFSPDGRYVYYSQDTTPGGTFQYSKDPSPGIYSIKRIDLETGDTETVISSTGGAIRPTPSPDGRYLAYVRRHNYQTKLFIHELETGKNTIVHHNLERDMQETWAIHGVYPGFAWTPDSKDLVFWAGGKIHRTSIKEKKATEIPFKVKTKHTMAKVLRTPIDVAPETFKTRMLRWVNVHPSGDRVVFQALGYLYVRDLPDGKPQRLTKQTDHFEFYPTWSRDGKHLAYVTWRDGDMGTIRVIAADGSGESKVITQKPGTYVEPAFTPDGSGIVYRKSYGGRLTGYLHNKNTGIYHQSLAGGEPKRLLKSGYAAHFGADGDRLFYVTTDTDSESNLRSLDLETMETRKHVTSKMGDEMRVSPDGKWLVFSEHYNAHVVPFTMSSKKFTVSPGGSNMPTAQLSTDAGENLHFSADSSRVYWSLGSNLYYRDLKDAFAFMDGAPEKLPEPGGEAIDIGFEVKHHVPEGVVAFEGARIITMKGDEVIEDGTIVIEGNRIVAVGKRDKVKVPSGAYKVDAKGKTIIPGLIDVHAHASYGTSEIIPQQNWQNYATLAFGVTTTHNPSTDTTQAFATTELTMAGVIDGPRVFSTGAILYGAHAPTLTAKINNMDDARSHLRRLKDVGAFSVKSYNQPRRNQRQQVIEAARLEGMMVLPEGGSLYQHNMSMVADGHTGIEHSLPVPVIYDDVVQFWSGTETGYTPTMGVAYGGISGEHYWYETTNVWEHPILSLHVPPYLLESRSRRRTMAPKMEYNHFRVAEGCKKLLDAGVLVHLGAHGQREGLAAHWELWMFAQGGMTPLEVLRCGTINGAKYLGFDEHIGSLEKGKLADLAVLESNPLEDIYSTDKVSMVMVNGQLFDAHTMNRLGNNPKPRLPYQWEVGGATFPNTTATQTKAICGGHCRH